MRLWTAARVPAARHERHPTTVAGGPGPSTARTGRNYRPYGLAERDATAHLPRRQSGGRGTLADAGVALVSGLLQRRGCLWLSSVVLRVGLVVGDGVGELPVAAGELAAV